MQCQNILLSAKPYRQINLPIKMRDRICDDEDFLKILIHQFSLALRIAISLV